MQRMLLFVLIGISLVAFPSIVVAQGLPKDSIALEKRVSELESEVRLRDQKIRDLELREKKMKETLIVFLKAVSDRDFERASIHIPYLLDTASSGVVATAVPAPVSQEFADFIRVSRRFVNSVGAGLSFQDYSQRLVEVNSQAEEAMPKISDDLKRRRIADFIFAINDAHSIWKFKLSSGSDRMKLQSISGMLAPLGYHSEIGDRWHMSFYELVDKYNLSKNMPNGRYAPVIGSKDQPMIIIDRAVQYILDYAVEAFREIEKY